jgi:two-component system, OmpR family, sensor histidine kinase VicK
MEYISRYECIECIGDQSSDAVFIYSLDSHRFLYSNSIFKNLFGFNKKEKVDENAILQYVLSEDKNYLESKYTELLKTGCISAAEFRLDFQDGNIRHLYCDIYRDNSSLIGFVKDITRNKEHENFLVEYTAKKDTFLDMITHNLSGPLNLSQNILGWVQKSILTKQDANALITLLQESIQECIDIVGDFLKEEHHESQMTFVRKTRFDVIERLKVIIEKLKDLNPDKQFYLITKGDNLNINSDSVKFFQIIHNLLSNSIKFTPANGAIYLAVEEEDGAYVFSVKDNGIGIPEDLKQYIFDKRSLARREGLKGEKSNGVGLYVIKKLVELVSGTIWFTSEENKGTTFFVKLPKE